MPNYCKLIIAGHLSKDPEVRNTASGMAVANSTIAFNHGKGDKQEVCFVDITLWDKKASAFVEFFKKGDPVLVEGRLRQETWEKDGQKRSKLSMVVDAFEFLKAKGEPAAKEPVRRQKPESTDYGEIPFGLLLSALPLLWGLPF